MSTEKTWQERVELAEHYLAIGNIDHFIYGRDLDRDTLPWEFVTEVKGGGSHRLDIQVELEIHAAHPCGLTFYWWVPLETRDADGRSTYRIDVDGVLDVLTRIPAKARPPLRAHLRHVSQSVLKAAAEQQGYADIQKRAGDALYALSAAETPS